jgi:hypothetical protein
MSTIRALRSQSETFRSIFVDENSDLDLGPNQTEEVGL